jgi:hypothetical protein
MNHGQDARATLFASPSMVTFQDVSEDYTGKKRGRLFQKDLDSWARL